jgi:hypothetical protein
MSHTEAQRAALKWLRNHGSQGVFSIRGSSLLAAGEWAPFTRHTWNALRDAGLVWWDKGRKRVTVTANGFAFDCGKTVPREPIEVLGGVE